MARSLGCSSDDPSEQLEFIRIHTLNELDCSRRQATTMYKLLGSFENGSTFSEFMSHLYLPSDLEDIRNLEGKSMEQEEADEINLLKVLKAHANTRGVAYNE